MKEFRVRNVLLCVLLLALLIHSAPAYYTAAASGSEAEAYEYPNEKPAEVKFTSESVFSYSSSDSPNLYCRYNSAYYNNGNNIVFLDETGKPISSERFKSVREIDRDIQVAVPEGSTKYAIYYKWNRITQPIYDDVEIQADCVIAKKSGGWDFFGMDGIQRFPGTLPSGYEARLVTSAGTVSARKYNASVTGSSGNKYYNFSLFDKNGKILETSGYTTPDNMEDPIRYYTAEIIIIDYSLYDLNGKVYGRVDGSKIIRGDNPRIITKANNVYSISDLNHNLIGSFEANSIGEFVGSSLVIYRNGRYGMVDQSGNDIVEPKYFSAITCEDCIGYYQKPEIKRLLFEDENYNYCLFDDKGNQLAVFRYDMQPTFYTNCIICKDFDENKQVYDLNGKKMFEFDSTADFLSVNGVFFLKDGSSTLYYVVDMKGNRLSEKGFTTIVNDDTTISVYGLVDCKYSSGWYIVNAMGTVLNDTKMDKPLVLMNPYMMNTDPSKVLGIYYQNGKCGICRYIPPVITCSKTADGKHNWKIKKTIAEATCTQEGTATFRCSACGVERTVKTPINPNNHAWDSGTVIQEAVCAEAGIIRYSCSRCDETRDETIPATGHAWTLTEILTEEESSHASMGLYTCTRCGETKEARLCAEEVFTDMPAEGNWAHDPIDWAYFNGVTAGKTENTFAPKNTVTRAEAVTFLWKTMGSPEPETEDNPFTDVAPDKYYYKPVLWAVENGVTSGATETTFAPKERCSRAQIMMFLWAAAGRPEPTTEENPFKDVSESKYYYKAVLWAVENGITGGISDDQFGPNNTCTRAQVVTFLYKTEALQTAVEPE